MRIILVLLIGVLTLTSCARSRITESTWIDKETEKILLSIDKKEGKFWLRGYGGSAEIVEEGADTYIMFRDQKAPIKVDNETLRYLGVTYIPISNSLKGQFTGKWTNETGNTAFVVQIDENVDLTWDIIKGAKNPIRYYPKRADNGFHFTVDQDTLSYSIKDGLIIDAKGTKYTKSDLTF